MCLSIPPKFSVAFVVGFLEGKSTVRIHRLMGEWGLTGLHFWSRGYCVSTTGLDDSIGREYIRRQEREETGQGELDFK
jgi:putative transposase